eukprot:gene7219-9850_t
MWNRSMILILYIFFIIQVLLPFVEAKSKSKKAKVQKPNDELRQLNWLPYVKNINESNNLHSYLFQTERTNDEDDLRQEKQFIQDIMKIIHLQQHIPKVECKSRRLLIVQMSSTSFEGTGSVLKQVLMSLAIAMHSNRTLIWGLGLPFMFEHSKELWGGDDNDHVLVNNHVLDCSTDADLAGGPFGCFFQKISSCSLADLTPSEMIEFSHNPYNESSRIMLSEIRKSMALYIPPFNLLETLYSQRSNLYTSKLGFYDYRGQEGHIWSAAIAAYVFRLKPELVTAFSLKYNTKVFDNQKLVWGLHIRHGDLKALKNVYGYKELFEFEDYFQAARELTHIQRKVPSSIFVSTDSVEADSIPTRFNNFFSKKPKANTMPIIAKFYYTDTLIGINKLKAHGSHTVAANGGCLRDPKYSEKGMRCALNYEDIILYQGLEEHRSVPRSMRLMRVLLESIEDIYLLSRCDSIIAQGSSHFSTLATMLIWAKSGAKNAMANSIFLDYDSIVIGDTPTAFLHGMNLLNGTHGIDKKLLPEGGDARWRVHTNSFYTGMKVNGVTSSPDMDPWNKNNQFRIVNGLPHVSEKLFFTEVRFWLGWNEYRPIWPGMCPGKMKKSEDPATYVVNVINLGVEHLDQSHSGQALQCWSDALNVMNGNHNIEKSVFDNALDVVKGNMASLRLLRYAEMVINENKDYNDFFKYNKQYMDEDAQLTTKDTKSGMRSIEDLNEEIVKLEAKLKKTKEMRDKMLEYAKLISNDGQFKAPLDGKLIEL